MSLRESYKKYVHLIKTDLYRYSADTSLKSFIATYMLEPGFNFMVWLRLRTVFKSKVIGFILQRKRIKFGIDIHTHNIGEGFYIGHFGHIVVSRSVIIGNNCNISQGVTLGVTNTGSKIGAPIIGDRVYIAPGAKLIGKVTIGNDVAIGANSVVTNDVPDKAVVVGVPARVVSYEGSSGYINDILP